MAVTKPSKAEFARRLASAGYEDFLILEREAAESVLTERRSELLETIATENAESITALAERLDRDISAVHRDLDVLFEYSLIEYDEIGRRKQPRVKHEHVFVEPLL
jgi:predicted transcriptional regulator